MTRQLISQALYDAYDNAFGKKLNRLSNDEVQARVLEAQQGGKFSDRLKAKGYGDVLARGAVFADKRLSGDEYRERAKMLEGLATPSNPAAKTEDAKALPFEQAKDFHGGGGDTTIVINEAPKPNSYANVMDADPEARAMENSAARDNASVYDAEYAFTQDGVPTLGERYKKNVGAMGKNYYDSGVISADGLGDAALSAARAVNIQPKKYESLGGGGYNDTWSNAANNYRSGGVNLGDVVRGVVGLLGGINLNPKDSYKGTEFYKNRK